MATRQCRRTLRDWALPLPLRTAARPLSVNAKYLKVDPKVNLVPKIRADTHERYAAGAPRPPARREDVLLHHTHSSATNEKMGGIGAGTAITNGGGARGSAGMAGGTLMFCISLPNALLSSHSA